MINVRNIDQEHADIAANLLAYLKSNCDWEVIKNYKLPVCESKEPVYLIPVSGGKDSTALALVLTVLFPSVKFKYVFTDTRAEPEDVYYNLDLLERMTGVQITRLSHPLGLFGYIDKYNGYLPSAQQRWCTSELKIKVLDNWFNANFDFSKQKIYTFVGFTYGEGRTGMVSNEEEVQSIYPFIKMKIDASKVFGILNSSIGISPIYKSKSRSGCFSCPFLRRYEKVMMFFFRYGEFARAKRYEKLTDLDSSRFELSKQETLRNALYGTNAMVVHERPCYFIPAAVDVRTEFLPHSKSPKMVRVKNKIEETASQQWSIFDLIDDDVDVVVKEGYVYVAIGYWISSVGRDFFGDMNYSGLYNTEFSTFSRSLTGLKRSLHFWLEHKLSVAPLYGMTKEEMLKDLKIGLFQVKLSEVFVDVINDPCSDSYTWSQTESYAQIETVVRCVNTVLTYEGWLQYWRDKYSKFDSYSDEELEFVNSHAYAMKKDIDKFKHTYESLGCSIQWSGIFPLPSEDEIEQMQMESIMSDDKEFKMAGAVACAICSI